MIKLIKELDNIKFVKSIITNGDWIIVIELNKKEMNKIKTGYQPDKGYLDIKNPPRGGSGVPNLEYNERVKIPPLSESEMIVINPDRYKKLCNYEKAWNELIKTAFIPDDAYKIKLIEQKYIIKTDFNKNKGDE
jgi:hypothetical protein